MKSNNIHLLERLYELSGTTDLDLKLYNLTLINKMVREAIIKEIPEYCFYCKHTGGHSEYMTSETDIFIQCEHCKP